VLIQESEKTRIVLIQSRQKVAWIEKDLVKEEKLRNIVMSFNLYINFEFYENMLYVFEWKLN
jgi:hypothetical protein